MTLSEEYLAFDSNKAYIHSHSPSFIYAWDNNKQRSVSRTLVKGYLFVTTLSS